MLRQRVLTALVLVAVLAAVLFLLPGFWFGALILLAVAAAGWEWARLCQARGGLLWGTVAATLALCVVLAALARGPVPTTGMPAVSVLWPVAAGLWLLVLVLALRAGVQGWGRWPQALRLGLGPLLLAAAWYAVVQWRAVGINALLSTLALVWAADIGAYAAGRAFGRRKLAPGISPGKTWEGVAGGWVAVAVLALAWLWLDWQWGHRLDSPSLYSILAGYLGGWGMALAIWLLAVLSVLGDLFESLLKRSVGAKDSSRLLPGHGGVLDRIDALLPVLPAALALAQPAWG